MSLFFWNVLKVDVDGLGGGYWLLMLPYIVLLWQGVISASVVDVTRGASVPGVGVVWVGGGSWLSMWCVLRWLGIISAPVVDVSKAEGGPWFRLGYDWRQIGS